MYIGILLGAHPILHISRIRVNHKLSYIYIHSLYTSIFPDRLNIAVVKELYKTIDKTRMTNYRPTSLLTGFSKVHEKATHSRLSHHLHAINILVTEQYGLKKHIN
jgi:hypothetical protein